LKDLLLINKTYIRPLMEYCIQVLSPHLKKKIVYRKDAEGSDKDGTKIPSLARLAHFGLNTLEERRMREAIIETYKIMTGKEAVDRGRF